MLRLLLIQEQNHRPFFIVVTVATKATKGALQAPQRSSARGGGVEGTVGMLGIVVVVAPSSPTPPPSLVITNGGIRYNGYESEGAKAAEGERCGLELLGLLLMMM